MKIKLGNKVVKNIKNWIPTDFDEWGRGIGIGEIVEPPFDIDDNEYDISWPAGRCFELESQIIEVCKIIRKNYPIYVLKMKLCNLDKTKCSNKFLSNKLKDSMYVYVKCDSSGKIKYRDKKEEYRIFEIDDSINKQIQF